MKTEPPPRHHHEGEPPPESLIHHAEPTLLEQWLRRNLARGAGFWAGVAVVVGGVIAAGVIAWQVGGPSRAGVAAWTRLASIAQAPSALSPFGPDPNAGLPERLRELAREYPDTAAARWAELRAATLLLNEGSAELATTRRSAGAGKIVEADEAFRLVFDSSRDDTLKRMAALGMARAAEARMGLDADDADHARLDDAIALYDRVIEDHPDTPEAAQAERLRRRLRRSDSVAFYEQLARFDPSATIPPAPSFPGLDLAPGQSSPLQDVLGLPPLGPGGLGSGGLGLPGGSSPGLDSFDFGLPSDASGPADPAGMPEPVALPETPPPAEPDAEPEPGEPAPDPTPEPATDPAGPAPDGPEAEAEAEATTPGSAPESPAEPSPSPEGTLPDDVFPSGGPGR